MEGMRGFGFAALGFVAAQDPRAVAATALTFALLAAIALWRYGRRRSARARAVRLEWGIHDLKQQLGSRLAEPRALVGEGVTAAPTLGASAALEADIEAAAKAVLLDAGGRRGKAKQMLRQRLNGHADGKLNGSEASYWRQLGALSFIDSTHDAMKAYARAAELAPDDTQAQMLLGFLYLRAGRLEAAEAAFRRQLAQSSGDAATGNGHAADGVRHRAGTMLGDVLIAKGEPEAALAAYGEALREVEALAEREPENAVWQRDLSIAHDRIADMLLARGDLDLALERCCKSLAIAEALAARDLGNTGWQRDLSVAHERLGEMLERKGDLDGALASLQAGLAIAEALVRREPERREWQWDLSASLDRLGDVLQAKGRVADAMDCYRRGLEIAQALTALEPARTAWQRDLAVSYHKLGQLEALAGNDSEARDLLERGRAIVARLDRIAAHQAQWRADLAKFDEALSRLGG
jgi:tetratricopeptide (TPR) repeat protein